MNELINTVWQSTRQSDRWVKVVANAAGFAYVRDCSPAGRVKTNGKGEEVPSRAVRMNASGGLPGYRRA